MLFGQFEVTPFFANCFVLGCEETREAVIIDAGEFSGEVAGFIDREFRQHFVAEPTE